MLKKLSIHIVMNHLRYSFRWRAHGDWFGRLVPQAGSAFSGPFRPARPAGLHKPLRGSKSASQTANKKPVG